LIRMVSQDKDFEIVNKAIYDSKIGEERFAGMMLRDRKSRFLMEASKKALEQEYAVKRYSRKVYEFKKMKVFTNITDRLVQEYIKKIIIINNIIVTGIKNYWKHKNSYENIMAELDELLDSGYKCNCRNIGFGFCFCVDYNGKYLNG
jgi:hypothetical protein